MTKRTGAGTSGKKTCGADTRTCVCEHHRRRLHVDGKGKCQEKRCKCHAFKAKPCTEDKLFPNGRCYRHGGKSLAGPASPSFKHGKYSKVLPKGLALHYETARTDPELVSVREELALLDMRAVQIVDQLNKGEAGGLWKRLKAARDKLQEYRQDKKLTEIGVALEDMLQIIDAGVRDAEAWSDLLAVTDLRRKCVETQSRRDKDLRQSVALSEFMVLIGSIAKSVGAHVKDPKAVNAVVTDLRRLIGPGTVLDAELITD